jgi:poly(3-hydroxybutyrate) depolymerase
MAFPNGVNSGFDVGECCVDADDVGFTRAMVADIQSVACIDSKRIYATGFSNGGGMSYKLACDAADIFAAVAPGSFQFGTSNVTDCNPSRPISIVAQNGTNDFAVPFEGGPTPVTNSIVFIGAQATFDKWSELNGCTGRAQDIGNNCTQVSGCEGGTENTLCVIEGGNHEQPGAVIRKTARSSSKKKRTRVGGWLRDGKQTWTVTLRHLQSGRTRTMRPTRKSSATIWVGTTANPAPPTTSERIASPVFARMRALFGSTRCSVPRWLRN